MVEVPNKPPPVAVCVCVGVPPNKPVPVAPADEAAGAPKEYGDADEVGPAIDSPKKEDPPPEAVGVDGVKGAVGPNVKPVAAAGVDGV